MDDNDTRYIWDEEILKLMEDIKNPPKKIKRRKKVRTQEVRREIALALIKARVRRKLNQRQLADRVGMKQPMLARLEKGEGNPTINTILRVAVVLDLKVRFSLEPFPEE